MVLRHLRSLVVAYDNLSELSRQDLTTALEIIKNREVLNRVRSKNKQTVFCGIVQREGVLCFFEVLSSTA